MHLKPIILRLGYLVGIYMKNNNVKPIGNILATYLYNYSIEDDYPSKIQDIIRVNKFEDFETMKIIKKPISTFEII